MSRDVQVKYIWDTNFPCKIFEICFNHSNMTKTFETAKNNMVKWKCHFQNQTIN